MYDLNHLYNLDCMEAMQQIPDGYIQLAIVDPPYGIGENGKRNATRGRLAKAQAYTPYFGYDKDAPPPEYFAELRRVSHNQIYSAQTILSAGYRLIVRAGLYGTRKTAEPILQTVNWHGPASKAL